MKTLLVKYIQIFTLCISFLFLFSSNYTYSQCNTNTTICTPGVAGPFSFQPASANPTGCLSFINGQAAPNYAYIILYITQGGTLDLLIQGDNVGTGCLDVQLFDITGESDPCASLDPSTEIGCNYVSPCEGCAEFGFTINGCNAQVAGPTVNAGDVIMILVEDYSDVQNSFTLELGNAPGSAQTGPPDPTITPVGTVCSDDPSFQLNAADNGGTWSGPGVSSTGLFDPSAAGVGVHTIDYTIGSAPCDAQDQTTIEVINCNVCLITNFTANISACDPNTGNYSVDGVVEFTDPPTTGQLVVEDCNGNQQTFNAPFTSPTNYNLTGLVADGAPCDVTAYFTDDLACTQNIAFTAPDCPCNFTFLDVNISACDPNDNSFEITGSVEFQSPPATGQLIIEDCNGNQQTFNAPFTSPTNYALTGIDSDGTTNCDLTAYFSDDPACTITSNPFDFPEACQCTADAGTYSDNLVGNSTTTGPYSLCFNDELNINANGDYTPPQDFNIAGVTYDPGVYLFVYDCPPTVFPPNDLNADPCLVNVVPQDQAWTIVNTVGDNSTLYFVPVTMYSMVDNYYAISINGGDWCYDMGPVYEVNFLEEITTNIVEDCQAGEAEVTINGGQPSFDGSSFTISNLLPGSASLSTTTVPDGGSVTISGLVDGDNYSFDIIDDSGCPQTISGTFTGTEDPSFNYATDTYCQDEVDPVANVTGVTGGTFSVNPAGLNVDPNTGQIDLSSATGSYTITYTTPDPVCFDQATYDVTINPVPVIDPLADQTACGSYTLPAITGTDLTGNEAYYDAPNGGGTQLNPGDVINTAGTSTFYIYDETGTTPNCFDEQTFDVTINIAPVLDPLNNQVACDSYTLPAITGTNLSGNEAYYDATNGGGTQYNAGDNITTVGTTTLYIYDETGTTPNCFDELTVDITINPSPVISVTSTDPTTCGGNDGTITISGLEANNSYDISYDDDGVTVGPTSMNSDANGEIVITGLNAGSYSNFVASLNGCTGTDNTSINLVDPNSPGLNAGPDQEVCDGTDVTLTADNPDGAIISWNNGVNDGSPFTPSVGTTTYTVTADLSGCISTDQVDVTVHPIPNVNAGNDLSICEGEDVILTASGADNYSWDNGVTDGVSFTPTSTTTYSVVGTTVEGCSNTDDVTITVNPLPTIEFEGSNLTGCVPVTATFNNLTGLQGSDCTWNFGDGNTTVGCGQVSHTYEVPGCYDVTLEVTSANGCTSTLTLEDYVCVGGYPAASFTFSPDELTNIDTQLDFENTSNGATSYEWDFGDGQGSTEVNPSHNYAGTAEDYEIELIAINNFGCTDTAYAVINVREELIFYVPNTFTPDKDDYNEVFLPVFTSGYDPFSYNLLIFNRWGEIIFESNDPEVGWDGTYGAESNRIVKDGTYVWKITYKTKGLDERKIAVGHVNVLK